MKLLNLFIIPSLICSSVAVAETTTQTTTPQNMPAATTQNMPKSTPQDTSKSTGAAQNTPAASSQPGTQSTPQSTMQNTAPATTQNAKQNTNEDPGKKQEKIIQMVMGGGVINEQLHQEFWSTVPKEARSQAMVSWMMDQLKITHQYQRALWDSALLSYKNKKVTKTDDFKKFDEALKKHITDNAPFAKGTKDYDNFVKSSLGGFKKAEDDNEGILVASANHSSIALPNGKSLELNEKIINSIIDNLNAEYARLQILFDPDYYTKQKQGGNTGIK